MNAYEKLEQELVPFCGMPHVVACSSGTAALHLALETLLAEDEARGGECVIPDYTMVACPLAATMAGLTPVFVDCGREDLTWDESLLERRGTVVGGKTAAVMAVNVYGRVAAYPAEWYKGGRPNGIVVVEDMAEAHGLKPSALADAACWSFYRNKIVAGEEGGAVAFRDGRLADVARELRCVGFDQNHDYRHRPRGHNYRLADSLAELVRKSLDQFPVNLAARREVEETIDRHPKLPLTWQQPPRESPWVYDLRVKDVSADTQTALVRALRAEGIEARHGFKPMSWQRQFKGCRVVSGVEAGWATRADEAATEVVSLPLHPALTADRVGRAFEVMREVLGVPSPT